MIGKVSSSNLSFGKLILSRDGRTNLVMKTPWYTWENRKFRRHEFAKIDFDRTARHLNKMSENLGYDMFLKVSRDNSSPDWNDSIVLNGKITHKGTGNEYYIGMEGTDIPNTLEKFEGEAFKIMTAGIERARRPVSIQSEYRTD